MDPRTAIERHASDRSRARGEILVALDALGIAFPRQLARATGFHERTIRWALFGKLPYYSLELAPVPLGLVRVVRTPRGRAYAITERGTQEARRYARRLREKARTYEQLAGL